MESKQGNFTAEYLDFHKTWESSIKDLIAQLNATRKSDAVLKVLTTAEELDAKLRKFPFNLQEEQSAALLSLSDVLDEGRFKYTHQKKLELEEAKKVLQNKIDAWGVTDTPPVTPFTLILHKKGRRNSEDNIKENTNAKKPRTEPTPTQNQFDALPTNDPMDQSGDVNNPQAENVQPEGTAPEKKRHVPPITLDNVANQDALLKHLREMTRVNLEAKLIGNKLRIFPQTAYAYNHIRRYIAEKGLEAYTYMLPEEKKLRVVIRGLPTDTSTSEIISHLESQNITVEECHIMTTPPKTNFWEGRRKITTPQQQPNSNSSKKSPQASSSTTEPNEDFLNQLKSPAVQETFELLEEFIKIATTIPTKYGRLMAIQKLLKDEITI
ncbi:nucleic-acid-binding protein from transposon X-element [Trichonephila clavata]|uniref:Nucleic-acid-binding protein from transposon X-element n=1 Tax=Trichonephila clavata TaxID=2740835 RepID=A0A8X6L2D7_TRICU|nr:nucleic-acid-binding protein from transposon X-element [Trichonephila clavata]